MAVLGEKLGDGPTDHSAGLGVVSGALFLRCSRVHPMLLMAYEKVATYVDCSQEVYTVRTWTGVRSVRVVCIVFPLQGVHRFELLRLLDMSNRLFLTVFT
jgi:hypothetical protein